MSWRMNSSTVFVFTVGHGATGARRLATLHTQRTACAVPAPWLVSGGLSSTHSTFGGNRPLMSVRNALPALLTLFALGATCPSATAGPWNPAPGEFSSEIVSSVFASDDFHNSDGDRRSLGGRFEQRMVASVNEIGWKKHTAFLIRVPYVSNTFRSSSLTTSSNNTGLGDIAIAFRRQLTDGASALAVQAEWTAPLGYNRYLDPGLGDGLQTLGASVHLGRALGSRGFWQLSGGMDRRFLSLRSKPDTTSEVNDRWANEAVASADLAIWLGRSLLVGGRYQGDLTLSHGNLLEDRTQHLVGPVAVYRVDDRLDVKAGSWHTALGKNVLHRNQYYVAVAFKNTRLNRLQGFLGGTAPGR